MDATKAFTGGCGIRHHQSSGPAPLQHCSRGAQVKRTGASVEQARAPVLALHGTASEGRQWRSLQIALAKEREVIAPDLPGYGSLADAPLATAPGLDTRLADLHRDLEAAPGPVHIIGHSFGGALGLRLAALIPHKVCSVCVYEPTSLQVLAVSGQQRDLAFLAEFRQLASITSRASALVAMETFLDYWMGPDSWRLLDHDARARLATMAPIVARDFMDALADSGTGNESGFYAGPTQVIFGGATIPSSRRIAELLSEQMPGAGLRQLHGLGHMGPLSASGTFNSACRAFIDSVEEGRAASCSKTP